MRTFIFLALLCAFCSAGVPFTAMDNNAEGLLQAAMEAEMPPPTTTTSFQKTQDLIAELAQTPDLDTPPQTQDAAAFKMPVLDTPFPKPQQPLLKTRDLMMAEVGPPHTTTKAIKIKKAKQRALLQQNSGGDLKAEDMLCSVVMDANNEELRLVCDLVDTSGITFNRDSECTVSLVSGLMSCSRALYTSDVSNTTVQQ